MANDVVQMNPGSVVDISGLPGRVLGQGPVLCLAVEPCDEIPLGAAVWRRHLASGDDLSLIVLTNGRRGDPVPNENDMARVAGEAESRAAARLLGYREPHFWGMSADSIEYGEELVARIMHLIEEKGIKLVYAPSVYDPDPVRAAIGLAAREALRRSSEGRLLVQYGIPRTIRPAVSGDIDACSEPAALKRFPAFSATDGSSFVDGFGASDAVLELTDRAALLRPVAGMAAYGWNLSRSADEQELVSVIIRSADRPELKDALDSVAAQTYRSIEVILVDVEGRGTIGAHTRVGPFPVKVASTGMHLGRGAAANVGLAAASGVYAVFLDDDDWFLPEHVAALVAAVQGSESAGAAYSGIECRTLDDAGDWTVTHVFNEPHDPVQLLLQNYMPMHAVLFERALFGDALRFDESLDVYEDWDFWVQLSNLTDFVHVDRITAVYRLSASGGFGVQADESRVLDGLKRFFDKWRQRWTTDQVVAIAGHVVRHVAQAKSDTGTAAELARQRELFERLQSGLARVQSALHEATVRLVDLQAGTASEREGLQLFAWVQRDMRVQLDASQGRAEALDQSLRETQAQLDASQRRAGALDQSLRETQAQLDASQRRAEALDQSSLETRAELETLRDRLIAVEIDAAAERERAATLHSLSMRQTASVESLEAQLVASHDLARSYGVQRHRDFLRFQELQLRAFWPIAILMLRADARLPGLARVAVGATKVLWWSATFKLRSALRQRAQANRIAKTGLFDELWYIERNPDLLFAVHRPLYHWLNVGWMEGRDPHPLFDTSWYLEQNQDVRDSRLNPLLHYLEVGARTGRDPHPLFDSEWYLQRNPDVAERGINPLSHFVRQGAKEGRDPHPSFSVSSYLAQNPDVVALGINPLVHYVEHGRQEGRVSCPAVGDAPAIPATRRHAGPGEVHMNLESVPGDHLRTSEALTLRGWAIAAAGLDEIVVLIDGQEGLRIERTIERPDVTAQYGEEADVSNSGFDTCLDLTGLDPGEHDLVVCVRSRSGAELRRHIHLTVEDSGDRWHLSFHRHQPAPAELEALSAQIRDWDRTPKLAALIACGLGFPERLLADLCAQVLPPIRVVLLSGSRPEDSDELDWKVPAWRDLHPNAPFAIDVLEPNAATETLRGSVDGVLLLDAADRLTRDALFYLARETLRDTVDMVYCDHDEIGDDALHVAPNLKPAWSPSLLLHRDYIGGCLLVSAERLDPGSVERCRDAGWRYRHALVGLRDGYRVRHVARVLWSKRAGRERESERTQALAEAWIGALDPLARIEVDPETGDRRVLWSLPDPLPKVSIIIPTTGNPAYLVPCVTSLIERTDYPAYELIFLDNGRGRFPEGISWLREQGLTTIECDEPFNWSRLNNRGALDANGDYLLFLNDDIEVTDPQWLNWLVGHAGRPGTGCVGALLYYPSGGIQHDGVFLVDHGGGARHWFHRMAPGPHLYQRLDRVTREVTAVTGACLLVGHALFKDLGGFDEAFAVTQNDVDFCLRVAARGLRNLVVADTSLVHHESVHRGDRSNPADDERMWTVWGDTLRHGDAYHHPRLVKSSAHCEVNYNLDVPSGATDADRAGVNCVAYVTAEMGLGEAARGILASLDAADIPVDAIDYRRGNPSRCQDRRWIHRLVRGEARYQTSIYIINADWLPTVKADIRGRLPRETYVIGYWAWELSEFPRRWGPSFDLVDEVWVASEHVRQGVQCLTEKPVRVIPNPVDLDTIDLPGRGFFGLDPDRFIFLSLFDVHSIVARKNPRGAIDAFAKAFDPQDSRVQLLIKVNNADAETLDSLSRYAQDRANVVIFDRVLTRREMNGLLQSCDVLVSLHRAEGFGLPPAEAMWLGKPVIATNYSGNTDFMTEANSALIPYHLVQIGVDQGPYEKDAVWAEPDLEAAAEAMRLLSGDRSLCTAIGRMAWRDARSKLSPQVVGLTLKDILCDIGSKVH